MANRHRGLESTISNFRDQYLIEDIQELASEISLLNSGEDFEVPFSQWISSAFFNDTGESFGKYFC